jgi:hypothetical protein
MVASLVYYTSYYAPRLAVNGALQRADHQQDADTTVR